MKSVLISGGTGLVGQKLSDLLISKGYSVSHLSRRKPKNGIKTFLWNPAKNYIEKKALENADFIVHLAGTPVADKRWTEKRKKDIRKSRSESAGMLVENIKRSGKKLQAFISASAVGYYGAVTSSKVFTEIDPPGNDFLAQCCLEWEKASEPICEWGVRRVIIRTGIVLAKKGGALSKIILPIRFHINPVIGSGEQAFPWIHIDDLCSIYLKAIEDEKMNGTFNAVACEPVSQKQLILLIKKMMRKLLIIPPLPFRVLKLILGERIEMLSEGSRVSCEKIAGAGYDFKFKKLQEALKNVL